MNAVAPKTSPVMPFNFLCDILPIIKITQKFKINPNKIAHKGKTKGKGRNQSIIATSQFFVETFSIILPVFEKVETLKKFLIKIIDNFPEAKLKAKITVTEYPNSTRPTTSPKRIKSPKVNATVP